VRSARSADKAEENKAQNTNKDDSGIVPSHYLIRVHDLAAAVADYQQAGFTVTRGSNPATAHNALIYF
jgi:hypothetical protein